MGRLRVIEVADLRHDANVFNLLRLFLASAVIFSHAYALLGVREADPSLQILPFTVSRLAVLLFFTLSGFLVTPSLVARGVGQFALARLLRMVPGLWVMLFVTSAIVLIGFTSVPLAQNSELFRYIGRNMLLLSGAYSIDGAFAGQFYPGLVNGSLWTIVFEVQCYILLAVAGALGIVRRRGLLLGFWLAGIALQLWMPVGAPFRLVALGWLAISFFAGVLMALWRDRVWLSWPPAIAVLGLAGLADAPRWDELAMALAAAYALIVVGVLAPRWLKRFSGGMPDYSYGIYIYAFPAQQMAIALGIGLAPATNMFAGFALALPFAMASWHFIEKPALGLKRRRTTEPALANMAVARGNAGAAQEDGAG